MKIEHIIESRKSVRTYLPAELSSEQIEAVERAVRSANAASEGKVTLSLVESGEDFQPSTYGVIKGASHFILMAYNKHNIHDCIRAGFLMERVVLAATAVGLGTCWIGGTFKQNSFAKAVTTDGSFSLNIVVPFGIAASRKRLLERITGAIAGSRNRKPFSELFFSNDFSTPLDSDNRFTHALAMMRLAPSAVNEQPWRAVVSDHTVHFYYVEKSEFAPVDLGIGLCHFADTLSQNGTSGTWSVSDKAPVAPPNTSYVCSFTTENC